MLLTDTAKTKETALQKKLIEKRNLFGLGVTSLIAACSADGAGGGGTGGGGNDFTSTLPFKAEKLLEPKSDLAEAEKLPEATDSDYTAEIETSSNDEFSGTGVSSLLDAQITKPDSASVFLNLSMGAADTENRAGIYQLTETHNLVLSAPNVENYRGRIFIYWDVADVAATPATDRYLEIKSTLAGGNIGTHAPEFFHIGGVDVNDDPQYDMVFASPSIDTPKGRIYVLWDVAEYKDKDGHTVSIGSGINVQGVESGLLMISGNGRTIANIGFHTPDFLQLGGAIEGGYDMIIRAYQAGNGDSLNYAGAIYVLWDIKSYHVSGNNIRAFNLSDDGTHGLREISAGATTKGATAGSLAIYGATKNDQIGRISAPDFLQLGGKDKNYDMVIRSHLVDKSGSSDPFGDDEGAIYILWDINDYYQDVTQMDLILKNKRIDLGEAVDSDPNYATAGLLTIYGAAISEQIGAHAPEFLQLGGADKNYDMVIRSERWIDSKLDGKNDVETEEEVSEQAGAIYVLWDINDYYKDTSKHKRIDLGETNAEADNYADSGLLTIKGAKTGDWIGINPLEFLQLGKKNDKYDMVIRSEHVDKPGGDGTSNEGAIYVLWDVADYANQNVSIDLATASSSLLTIYGEAGSKLGSSDILYKANNEDSDVDGDGTNDLVFKDKDYTYVLFGDKIATTTGTGEDAKVASKTIDLNKIKVSGGGDQGFFGNDIDAELGYRFAKDTGSDGSAGYTTFKQVQDAFPKPAGATLSDADADLGVWDIA